MARQCGGRGRHSFALPSARLRTAVQQQEPVLPLCLGQQPQRDRLARHVRLLERPLEQQERDHHQGRRHGLFPGTEQQGGVQRRCHRAIPDCFLKHHGEPTELSARREQLLAAMERQPCGQSQPQYQPHSEYKDCPVPWPEHPAYSECLVRLQPQQGQESDHGRHFRLIARKISFVAR